MYELKKYVRFMSGSPQFRIVELSRGQAKEYEMYSQKDLMEDLTGIEDNCETSKKIYTNDIVSTLDEKLIRDFCILKTISKSVQMKIWIRHFWSIF